MPRGSSSAPGLVRALQITLNHSEKLTQLRRRIPPIQNTLISTLAFIFPIELLSPPDLLFTILDVPLPIPNGLTDPAPPFSLPSHKDINEETVATALGYAAQVVQLLAAYLGIRLTYPVTCVGSRSLIKDGISHMVGPRMYVIVCSCIGSAGLNKCSSRFPLFSKGVDTYRFEYAVFLLNKDIELVRHSFKPDSTAICLIPFGHSSWRSGISEPWIRAIRCPT